MGDQDRRLTLLHLRKTVSECSKGNAQETFKNNLTRILPLFRNVSALFSPVELRKEWREAPAFAHSLSTIFVHEIRLRAASEGTREAARLIGSFLARDHGLPLLNAIHFLIATDDDAIIDNLCKTALPSTLVKILYLFLDLHEENHVGEEGQLRLVGECMEALCCYKRVSEELSKNDDLAILFIASSSVVRPPNRGWRNVSGRTLETMATRSFSPLVIKYIVHKQCLKSFLANIVDDSLEALEVCVMYRTLFVLIKASLHHSFALSDDFRSAGGFIHFRDFILHNQADEEMINTLLQLMVPLVACGPAKLNPQQESPLVSLPSFQLPVASDYSIRYVEPVTLLHSVFSGSSSPSTSISVLEAIDSIYKFDSANYFILDRFHPLSSLMDKMAATPLVVQKKVLEMTETILTHLHYIPCKELISLSILAKGSIGDPSKNELLLVILQTCFKMLMMDPVLKDAFREVALLDTACAALLFFFNVSKERPRTEAEHKQSLLVTDLLTVLIKGNLNNARLFGDLVGPRFLLNIVRVSQDEEWRSSTLQLLRQLLLLMPSDAYMSNLLSAFSSFTGTDDDSLMTELLKTLLGVLRESHKARVLFRRSGGYVCILSLLLALEGSLAPVQPQDGSEQAITPSQCAVLHFINLVFKVLTISMRFEPSNASFFAREVAWESVTTVLRLTGAFTDETRIDNATWRREDVAEQLDLCNGVFSMDEDSLAGEVVSPVPPSTFSHCFLLRFVMRMALDNYEKESFALSSNASDEGFIHSHSVSIVHAGAVITFLQLLPSLKMGSDEKWWAGTQLCATLMIRSLLRDERNQQLMCQAELPRIILSTSSAVFLNSSHPLLPHFYYFIERLSYQSMQPCQLRNFLRLDFPLCCRSIDAVEGETETRRGEGGPLPLQRIKALVSMMTPRDQRVCAAPPFVEMDMSQEGFGCLFIPSLSSARTERIFPPTNGLTYSFWLRVDVFSNKQSDLHPLRLLSLYRQWTNPNGHAKQAVCLSVQLSPIDRSLLVSTEEYDNFGSELESEAALSPDKVVRVAVGDCLREGEWNHFCLVFTRSVLKNSQLVVYLNGSTVSSVKCGYITQHPGGAASSPALPSSVNALIGTPPLLRRPSKLRWKMAAIFLIEDVVNEENAKRIAILKPHYVGNLHSNTVDGSAIVAEEKILLSLNGAATTELTLANIRGLYSKNDAEMTGSLIGLSPNDNSTPLRALVNTCTHCLGGARPFGAILVGYLGMRTFCPRAVPHLLDSVGGFPCLFALVSQSSDSEELYASLKAVVSAVHCNIRIKEAMDSASAYQLLAVLLEDKGDLFNSHIVHLIFSLVGTLDSDSVSSINYQALEDLIGDLFVWRKCSDEMHRLLLDHIHDLMMSHSSRVPIGHSLRRVSFPCRLLMTLQDRPFLLGGCEGVVFDLVSLFLSPPLHSPTLLKLAQLISWSLPCTSSECEEESSLPRGISPPLLAESSPPSPPPSTRPLLVYMRNRLLSLVVSALRSPSSGNSFGENLVRTVGFDCFLSILSIPRAHEETTILCLQVILALLAQPQLMAKFKEGEGNGGWLREVDDLVRKSAGTVLGFSVSAEGGEVAGPMEVSPLRPLGFSWLEHVVSGLFRRPHGYVAMFSLLGGGRRPLAHLDLPFHSLQLCTMAIGVQLNGEVLDGEGPLEVCGPALGPLLGLVRKAIHCPPEEGDEEWRVAFPATAIEILSLLYHSSSPFVAVAHSDHFASILFSALAGSNDDVFHFEKLFVLKTWRLLYDLLKRILVAELQNSSKGIGLTEGLIELVSDNPSTVHQLLLSRLLFSLLSSGFSSSPPSHSLNSSIGLLAARAVDCLWHGLIPPSDASRMIPVLCEVQERVDGRGGSSLLRILQRAFLFALSRPIHSIPQQSAVLDVMSTLLTKKYLVQLSNESSFFACLCHWVFVLSVTPDLLCPSASELEKGSAQVAMCAVRVWTDLLCTKRALLEETFKRPFVLEINAARALLSSSAGQSWLSFVESQLVQVSTKAPVQQNIGERINQVAIGLSRLASRKGLTSSSSLQSMNSRRTTAASEEEVLGWAGVHVGLVRQLVAAHATRYQQAHGHIRKWALQQWRLLFQQLTRQRAIWGPDAASSLDKYKLDMTEASGRIRKKLIPNGNFYRDFPYRPYLEDTKSKRTKVAISHDSKKYYEAQLARRPKMMEESIIVTLPTDDSSPSSSTPPLDLDSINDRILKGKGTEKEEGNEATAEEDEEVIEQEEEKTNDEGGRPSTENGIQKEEEATRAGPDNQTLLRLLEDGEALHSMFRCARIQGLETAEGLLLFGREHFYVIDGFTLLKTREIRDLDYLPPEQHDPIVPYTATGTSSPPLLSRQCSKFSYASISEVHRRRYLLQPIAVEVFSTDGRNFLLAFPKKMRERVYEKLMSVGRAQRPNVIESVVGQKHSLAVENSASAAILQSLIGQQSVTQRWLNGSISNFQYLMHLNTLAGRSYNDLSQYPVFPWILSDYSSPSLNLCDPSSFRDFSKPMGAQTEERLGQYLKRYREWEDPSGETPPYLYGTHYSSAMIVLSYLVRMEPFAQQFITLQGGHFDLADRMFHSVGDAWTSASRKNMADVKELIPEFFTLPEMFMNNNNFDLGTKQNGTTLGDVILPPWAKGDPREFVRIHRMALESDYVSSHLHEWIDLVFGYKQTGPASVASFNVFHHLFYEGSVSFDAISDPLTRNATIGFVNNFGQIPSQLFKKPHPHKKVAAAFFSSPGVSSPRLFYHSLHTLRPSPAPIKEAKSAISSIVQTDKGVHALPQGHLFIGHSKFIAWSFPDRSLRLGNVDSEKSLCVMEMNNCAELTCAATDEQRSLLAGTSDGCIVVWSIQAKGHSLHRKAVLDGHSDAVTALAVSNAHSTIVSGSRDCTVLVWHLRELYLIRQLFPHPSPISAVSINECTGDIASGCGMQLSLWSCNGELLSTVAVGESPDSSLMVLSIAFSTMNDWDEDNVVLVGTSDGVVSVFSCVVVQNDGSLQPPRLESREVSSSVTKVHRRLEKQRNRLGGAGSRSLSPSTPCSPSIESGSVDGWVRLLVHRASLTTPGQSAPITAISPTRDHGGVLVGDGLGRVWQWGMADGEVDHWLTDLRRQRCAQCQHNFTLAEKKYNCKNCGQRFCGRCSRFESQITHVKISHPIRVCQSCYIRLKAQSSAK